MRIAVLDDYQGVAARYGDWAALDAEIDYVSEHLEPDALTDRVGACDVVVAMRERTPFPRAVLAALPQLRLLVTTGMRNASIDLAAAKELDVTVSGTRAWGPATSELTWALIMGLVRPVWADDAAVRSGDWQRTVGGDLSGRTIGLVGLGRQGSAVARMAAAFDMRVLAWSEHLTVERASEHGAELVDKHELFARSDFVSLHLVLSERTAGVIGHEELRAMRPESYLVNSARALLIEQDALRAAVEGEWLAGVALDVYDIEPLPVDHWLRRSPRTLLSPHMGYVSDAGYRAFYGDAVADITGFLAGEPVRVLND